MQLSFTKLRRAISNHGTILLFVNLLFLDAGSTIISDEAGEPSNTATQTKKPANILPSMKVTTTNDATVIGTIQGTKSTENIQTFSQAASTTHSKYFENQNDYNAQGYSHQGTSYPLEYPGSYQTNSENVGYTEPNDVSLFCFKFLKQR